MAMSSARFASLLIGLLMAVQLHAAAGDAETFGVTVTPQSSPAAIAFTWTPGGTAIGTVHRRTLGTLGWSSKVGDLAVGATSFTDTTASVGVRYEYRFIIQESVYRYAYVAAGIDVPLEDQRGKVILLVDETMATPCAAEIALLIRDLAGDGWQVIRHDVPRDDGNYATRHQAKTIKDTWILPDWNADKTNTKAVILFGRVPVPYSGNMIPDGHYTRAIPTDGYYSALTQSFTDTSINNTATGATRTNNIPGDGKWDANYFTKTPELMLGRIDTWNMPAFTGQSEADLLKRYVAKAHAWRHKQFAVENKTVHVTSRDWNWAFFSSQKNLGLVRDNTPDILSALRQRNSVYAYFGNTGGVDNVSGYSTAQLAAQNVNATFMFEGGSYSLDWDQANSFMRCFIAASGTALTSGWSEFPGYYIHHLGIGAPIGESIRIMQYASTADYKEANYNTGYRALYVNMMGDPTIRLHRVAPPTALTASAAGAAVALSWTASSDAVAGYHVYRGATIGGAMTRLTGSPITGTTYTDSSARSGDVVYMVRAIRKETGTGTYWNASQGVFAGFSGSGGGNLRPTAQAQSVSTPEDTSLAITLSGSDPEGDAIGYAVTVQPANGTLQGTPPNLTYKPYANWFGSDSFAFTVQDAFGASQPATVSITVNSVNDRPVAAAYTLKAYTANGGQPSEVVCAATDVEKSPLTFAIASQPAQGTAQLIDGNVLRYVPNGSYTGADSFTYVANDGQDNSTPVTVSVTVSAAPNLADGLVAHYPFSDAAGSTTAADASGNAKTATLLNGASMDTAGGVLGGALGTGAATQVCQVPQLWTTTSGIFDASVAAWFKADDPGNNTRFQVILEAGTYWTIYVRNATLYVLWDGQWVTSVGIQPGRWYHVAMTLDSSPYADYYNRVLEPNRRTVYLDGAIIARGSYSLTPRLLDTYGIGNLQVSAMFHDKTTAQTADAWFAGRIDDARWYGRKLEPSEVYALYLAGGVANPGSLAFTGATASTTEGDSGSKTVTFTVARTGGSTGAVAVNYATANGTASAGSDYTAASGTLNWAGGDAASKSFTVTVLGDTVVEGDETVLVSLASPTGGATVGAPSSATLTILNDDTPANSAPTITTAKPASLTVDEDTAGTVSLAATDANGDTLTWSIQTQGTKGVAAVSGTGSPKSVTYTPTANLNGSDAFVVQVSDGKGGTDTITVNVTITAVNDAPVATAQSVTVTEDTAKAITLAGTDVEGSALTYAIGTSPTKGVLSGTAPNLTYTPNLNASGADSFTFTVHDGSATSAAATVSITITAVNDAPVATAQSVTVTEDTAKAITLAGTDVEGSALTYAVGTSPTKGVLSGTAPNLTYTPNLNATGADSFAFTVNDGTATSAAATVSITITAVNDAPVLAAAIPDQTATVGVAFSYQVPVGTFTDVDSASLTWSSDEALGWLSFTAATRTFSGTPAAGDIAATTITVSASDGSLSASDSFVLTVSAAANAAPTITTAKPASLMTNEDTAGTVSLAATDTNGDTLTWSIQTQGTKGTASVSGTGSPRTVTYAPTANLNGSDSFVAQVSDGKGGTDTITVDVTITAVNDAPSFTKGADQTVLEDAGAQTVANWATAVSAGPSNESSQTLAFTVSSSSTALFSAQPAVAANGTLTYTPAANASGVATVTVTLADNGGTANGGVATAAAQSFTITVTAVNDPPVNTVAPATSGKSTVGREQTATSGTWSDLDGVVTGYAYQWQRALGAGAYADIAGATAASYTPVAADAGYALRVRVTATDNGTPGTASSAAVSAATLVKGRTATPSVTSPTTLATATPTVTGTSLAGATISVYDGAVLIGTVAAGGSGSWTWTAVAPLTAGTHALTVTAELAPEGESATAGPILVTVTGGRSSGNVSSAGSGGGCGAGGLLGLLGLVLLPWLRRKRHWR